MKKPLFRMLWCESVAPFGKPVVPDVYWMLIGSSNCSAASRSASSLDRIALVPPAQQVVPVVVEHERLAQARAAVADLGQHRRRSRTGETPAPAAAG